MTTTDPRPPEIYDTQEYSERFESLECDLPWERQIQFTSTNVWRQEGVITVPPVEAPPAVPVPVLNVDLLTRVREHVLTYPEQHDQSSWVVKSKCGTTACIGGWAVLLHGDALERGMHHPDNEDDTTTDHALMDNGKSIQTFAQQLLGLTYSQADRLFLSENEESLEYLNDLITEVGAK